MKSHTLTDRIWAYFNWPKDSKAYQPVNQIISAFCMDAAEKLSKSGQTLMNQKKYIEACEILGLQPSVEKEEVKQKVLCGNATHSIMCNCHKAPQPKEWCEHMEPCEVYQSRLKKAVNWNFCPACGKDIPRPTPRSLKEELAKKFEEVSTNILYFHDEEGRTPPWEEVQVIHKARFGEMADIAISFLKDKDIR